jgi:SAM-dependent methyltransferase
MNYAEVADLYDSYVRFEADIPFFLEECRASKGPVVELMSGAGRVSVPLLEAGISLTCVDSSGPMLAILRQKLSERSLSATVIEGDVRSLSLPSSFDLAILPFHAFGELVTEDDRQMALASTFRCLSPGGRFICTLHNPAVRLRSVTPAPRTVGRFPKAGGAGELVLRVSGRFNPRDDTVEGTQILEEFDGRGDKSGERRTPIKFVLLSRRGFEALACAAGFEVAGVWGDYSRSPFSEDSSLYIICSIRRPKRA